MSRSLPGQVPDQTRPAQGDVLQMLERLARIELTRLLVQEDASPLAPSSDTLLAWLAWDLGLDGDAVRGLAP